jgi:hypothetical protein
VWGAAVLAKIKHRLDLPRPRLCRPREQKESFFLAAGQPISRCQQQTYLVDEIKVEQERQGSSANPQRDGRDGIRVARKLVLVLDTVLERRHDDDDDVAGLQINAMIDRQGEAKLDGSGEVCGWCQGMQRERSYFRIFFVGWIDTTTMR